MILGEMVMSFLLAWVFWLASRNLFSAYVFQRRNYRDHPLPTGVGVLIPFVVAAFVAMTSIVGFRQQPFVLNWNTLSVYGPVLTALAAGFALLGLVDDLGGVGESGGFRGHIRALLDGHLTTGALKLIGGPVLTLAVLGRGSTVVFDRSGLLRDAALVCLGANLINLFDRAPGRAIKAGIAGFAIMWIAVASATLLAPTALVIGGAAGLLIADLREELMIGDAGSNVIGASLGYGVVVAVSDGWKWWILLGLLTVNLVSERVSFSRVIDAVAPLRWLDRLGAPHRPA